MTEENALAGNPEPADLRAAVAARLESLTGLPVGQHADIYQLVHVDLQAALARVDGR
jgi:hypothetical protein